jgi:hypothetical protein
MTLKMEPAGVVSDIDGATIAHGPLQDIEATLHDPAAPQASIRAPGTMRVAPPTMISNVGPSSAPGKVGAIAPEDAVVDVGAPAYAYVARPGGPPPGYGPPAGSPPPGYGAPLAMMHHGAPGHAQPPQHPSGASTRTMVLLVGGLILLAILAVGGAGGFYFYVASQHATAGGAATTHATTAPATPERPKAK